MRTLSKSKIIAYRQCPKRLWLEVHLREMLESGFELRHLSFERLFREAPETEFSPLMEEFLAAGNAATTRFGREQES